MLSASQLCEHIVAEVNRLSKHITYDSILELLQYYTRTLQRPGYFEKYRIRSESIGATISKLPFTLFFYFRGVFLQRSPQQVIFLCYILKINKLQWSHVHRTLKRNWFDEIINLEPFTRSDPYRTEKLWPKLISAVGNFTLLWRGRWHC